ncbi:hypothetical protein Dda_7004 [Drechslerella dactyloides]|uniref:Chromo domain-containing protein n=1 Tax=Drechslerella dactyloides TaxID=74499 RepID=A0AAD6IT00_DREDA|nr:hypothetical protein Dda_7004 [Drechslerella dactyloides]
MTGPAVRIQFLLLNGCQMVPFAAVYGFIPCCPFEIELPIAPRPDRPTSASTAGVTQGPESIEDVAPNTKETLTQLSTQRERLRSDALDAIEYGKFAAARYFDKNHEPLPNFKPGDRVHIRYATIGENGYTAAGVKSKKPGIKARLDIPKGWDISPAISVIHLDPAPAPIEGKDNFGRVHRPDPDKTIVPSDPNDDRYYEVDSIIDHKKQRGRGNKLLFKVMRKGWPREDATWESEERLKEDALTSSKHTRVASTY